MTKLSDYVKRELELAGMFEADFEYGGLLGLGVMGLAEELEKRELSAVMQKLTVDIFAKLVTRIPLTPIKDEGWQCIDRDLYQNERCSRLLKGKNGKAFFTDAIRWVDVTMNNSTFYGTVRDVFSIRYVTFPFTPKTFDIKMSGEEILDGLELERALKYYPEQVKMCRKCKKRVNYIC